MGDLASWLSRFMLSSRPWENWCREPQRRQEAENQAQGSYPEVLVEGNKRRGSAGSQVIVSLGDWWESGHLGGERKAGRGQSWSQLWIWLRSGVQKLAHDPSASLWGSRVNSWALGSGEVV